MLGEVSLNREIEFMIQMLGWSEEQIASALVAAHPKLSGETSLTNQIRVCRSRFRADRQEGVEVSKLIGSGTVASLDSIKDKRLIRFASGIEHIDTLWGFSDDMKSKGFPRGQAYCRKSRCWKDTHHDCCLWKVD